MKRLNSSVCEPTINDYPDVLPLAFSYLKLTDLFIVQLVCKLWNSDVYWYQVAFQKGFYIKESEPVRAQVLTGIISYCEAARIIFPGLTVQKTLPPVVQKDRIDREIAGIDKTGMDPVQSLSDSIQECMQMIPVWVETGLLTINEDLLMSLCHHLNLCDDFHELLEEAKDLLIKTIISGRRKFLDNLPLKPLEEIHQTLTPLYDYIYQFDDPSDTMLNALTHICTALPLLHRMHQIALVCCDNGKKGILHLISKKTNWESAFEKFMFDEGIDLYEDFQLPPFFQYIVQQIDEEQFKTLIRTVSGREDYKNIRINYIVNLLKKTLVQTLYTIRLEIQ